MRRPVRRRQRRWRCRFSHAAAQAPKMPSHETFFRPGRRPPMTPPRPATAHFGYQRHASFLPYEAFRLRLRLVAFFDGALRPPSTVTTSSFLRRPPSARRCPLYSADSHGYAHAAPPVAIAAEATPRHADSFMITPTRLSSAILRPSTATIYRRRCTGSSVGAAAHRARHQLSQCYKGHNVHVGTNSRSRRPAR